MENQPLQPKEQPTKQMSDNSKRPGCITAYCIFGFLTVGLLILGFMYILTDYRLIGYFPNLYLPFIFLLIPINLVAYVGLWKMKKWSVMLITIITAVSLILSLSIFRSNIDSSVIIGFLISIGILAYLRRNLSKMS